jgi:hypothetical protein
VFTASRIRAGGTRHWPHSGTISPTRKDERAPEIISTGCSKLLAVIAPEYASPAQHRAGSAHALQI